MPFPWTYWILPAVVVLMWANGWRRTRSYRLYFALFAPLAAIGGNVLALVMGFAESRNAAASCVGGSCHSVANFTASIDNPSGFDALIGEGSALAFYVAVPLGVLTLIVEFVLLVRRDKAEEATAAEQ